MIEAADVVVIGGGIAGVTAAQALSGRGMSVVLVEREPTLAHHTTGRSAATFLETYGNRTIQSLTRASRAWFEAHDLLARRPMLVVSGLDPADGTDSASEPPHVGGRALPVAEAYELCPALRPDWVRSAMIEDDAADIDVAAALEIARRGLLSAGGHVATAWPVIGLHRRGDRWRVQAATGQEFDCNLVLNAAGAWADEIASMAGANAIGLLPLRRTIAVVRAPHGLDVRGWPLVCTAEEGWYLKPEGDLLLVSPADEIPSAPVDARPEELDVALGIERVNEATTLRLRSVVRAWAGLRTFAPDRTPVFGEDPRVEGFFWLAGQGGYGIQTAPALAAAVADLMTDIAPSADALIMQSACSPRRWDP